MVSNNITDQPVSGQSSSVVENSTQDEEKAGEEKQKIKKTGPDSFESWRMVFYCFTNTFLVGGSTRSAPVLYVAVMETFNVDRGAAAWPISLISGFVNFAGILSGPLSTKFGLRISCIIGGSVSVFCLSGCYFVRNIAQLTVLFGILNGIGIGIMYNLNPVILTHYFRKYKSVALGINYTGSTIAAMVFPKFMEFLYINFGLHGLFLIFAGIMLVTPLMSSFMRKPSWRKTEMRAPNVGKEIIRRLTISSTRTSRAATMNQRSRRSTTAAAAATDSLSTRSATTPRSRAGSSRSRATSISVMGLNIGTPRTNSPDLMMATDIGIGALRHTTSEEELDEANSYYLDSINVREEQVPYPNEPVPTLQRVPTLSGSVEIDKGVDLTQVSDALEEERELSLAEIFCNPLFYLLVISYLTFTTYTDILLAVMVDLFTDKGIDQSKAIATIPLISVTDMAGRLLLPFLVDKRLIDRKVIFAVNYLCLGCLAFAIPSFHNYSFLTSLFLLVGWFYGSTVVMCTIIVSDILGVHNLAVANGLICSTVGFISFGRPTFIGYFRDTVGSYDPMLYFWGVLLLILAVVWTVVICVLRRRSSIPKF